MPPPTRGSATRSNVESEITIESLLLRGNNISDLKDDPINKNDYLKFIKEIAKNKNKKIKPKLLLQLSEELSNFERLAAKWIIEENERKQTKAEDEERRAKEEEINRNVALMNETAKLETASKKVPHLFDTLCSLNTLSIHNTKNIIKKAISSENTSFYCENMLVFPDVDALTIFKATHQQEGVSDPWMTAIAEQAAVEVSLTKSTVDSWRRNFVLRVHNDNDILDAILACDIPNSIDTNVVDLLLQRKYDLLHEKQTEQSKKLRPVEVSDNSRQKRFRSVPDINSELGASAASNISLSNLPQSRSDVIVSPAAASPPPPPSPPDDDHEYDVNAVWKRRPFKNHELTFGTVRAILDCLHDFWKVSRGPRKVVSNAKLRTKILRMVNDIIIKKKPNHKPFNNINDAVAYLTDNHITNVGDDYESKVVEVLYLFGSNKTVFELKAFTLTDFLVLNSQELGQIRRKYAGVKLIFGDGDGGDGDSDDEDIGEGVFDNMSDEMKLKIGNKVIELLNWTNISKLYATFDAGSKHTEIIFSLIKRMQLLQTQANLFDSGNTQEIWDLKQKLIFLLKEKYPCDPLQSITRLLNGMDDRMNDTDNPQQYPFLFFEPTDTRFNGDGPLEFDVNFRIAIDKYISWKFKNGIKNGPSCASCEASALEGVIPNSKNFQFYPSVSNVTCDLRKHELNKVTAGEADDYFMRYLLGLVFKCYGDSEQSRQAYIQLQKLFGNKIWRCVFASVDRISAMTGALRKNMAGFCSLNAAKTLMILFPVTESSQGKVDEFELVYNDLQDFHDKMVLFFGEAKIKTIDDIMTVIKYIDECIAYNIDGIQGLVTKNDIAGIIVTKLVIKRLQKIKKDLQLLKEQIDPSPPPPPAPADVDHPLQDMQEGEAPPPPPDMQKDAAPPPASENEDDLLKRDEFFEKSVVKNVKSSDGEFLQEKPEQKEKSTSSFITVMKWKMALKSHLLKHMCSHSLQPPGAAVGAMVTTAEATLKPFETAALGEKNSEVRDISRTIDNIESPVNAEIKILVTLLQDPHLKKTIITELNKPENIHIKRMVIRIIRQAISDGNGKYLEMVKLMETIFDVTSFRVSKSDKIADVISECSAKCSEISESNKPAKFLSGFTSKFGFIKAYNGPLCNMLKFRLPTYMSLYNNTSILFSECEKVTSRTRPELFVKQITKVKPQIDVELSVLKLNTTDNEYNENDTSCLALHHEITRLNDLQKKLEDFSSIQLLDLPPGKQNEQQPKLANTPLLLKKTTENNNSMTVCMLGLLNEQNKRLKCSVLEVAPPPPPSSSGMVSSYQQSRSVLGPATDDDSSWEKLSKSFFDADNYSNIESGTVPNCYQAARSTMQNMTLLADRSRVMLFGGSKHKKIKQTGGAIRITSQELDGIFTQKQKNKLFKEAFNIFAEIEMMVLDSYYDILIKHGIILPDKNKKYSISIPIQRVILLLIEHFKKLIDEHFNKIDNQAAILSFLKDIDGLIYEILSLVRLRFKVLHDTAIRYYITKTNNQREITISILDILSLFGAHFVKIFFWLLIYLTDDNKVDPPEISKTLFGEEDLRNILETLPSDILYTIQTHVDISTFYYICDNFPTTSITSLIKKNILLVIIVCNGNCTYGYDNGFIGAKNMIEKRFADEISEHLLKLAEEEDEEEAEEDEEKKEEEMKGEEEEEEPGKEQESISKQIFDPIIKRIKMEAKERLERLNPLLKELNSEKEIQPDNVSEEFFNRIRCHRSFIKQRNKYVLYKPTIKKCTYNDQSSEYAIDSHLKSELQYNILVTKCYIILEQINSIVYEFERQNLVETRSFYENVTSNATQAIFDNGDDDRIWEKQQKFLRERAHIMNVYAGSKKNKKYTRKIKKSRSSSQKLNSRRKYKRKISSKQSRKRIYEKSSNSKQRRTRKIRK
jgi:hypothetical protein